MSKANQTNDAQNTPIANCIDGSTPKLHKAAAIRGGTSGNNSKPVSNGGK